MFSTYPSAVAWLYARNQFAIKLGLGNTRTLLAELGNPERDLRILHVAGTNGKGSVCAALAGMLPALGFRRIGLYTSPHLVSFRERIRVDGEPIPANYVTEWLNRNLLLLERLNPTYFEIVTAMALCRFRDAGCGAVVLETGLGGRLDATNVVVPGVSVITSIGFDHADVLGSTLEAIQREKLGIVKRGVPLVVDEVRPPLVLQAAEAAAAADAPLRNLAERLGRVPGGWSVRGAWSDYALPDTLRPDAHGMRNAALAVLALEAFHGAALPPAAEWMPLLHAARLPGRLQALAPCAPGLLPVLLDGAHNPAGMEALCAYLSASNGASNGAADGPDALRVFFACMADKDVPALLEPLRALPGERVFVDLTGIHARALGPAAFRALLPAEEASRWRVADPDAAGLRPLLEAHAGGPTRAVFCGSLYLLGAVIPALCADYAGLEAFSEMLDAER